MKETLLSIRNLSKVFKVGLFSKRQIWAVRDVSFEVRKGEVFALVGESGSGKSTVGKVILRLERPTTGQLLFNGEDPFSLGKEYTRQVSAVFQDPRSSLNPRMSVREIIEEPLLVHGQKDRHSDVVQALRDAGLSEEFLERKQDALSGGQRQRVAIARAIVVRPKLIVADEPTSSLDMSYREEILSLFKKLRDGGISTLLITHDLRAVEKVSDRMGVMNGGRLLESGDTQQILNNPLHPYTQYLIRSMPVRHPSQRREQTEEQPFSTSEYACPFFYGCSMRLKECEDRVKEVEVDGRIVSCNLY